jgi:glutamate N-acetyltransferase/amino-acid N-acetyltransferase
MKVYEGLSVQGFKAGGKRKGKYGLALVLSEEDSNCSIMVTSNNIRAPPVDLSIKHSKKGTARSVVISSGNANSFTGKGGRKDAEEMCRLVSSKFNIEPTDVIVNSTGIIGQRLDMDLIKELIIEVSKETLVGDEGIINAADAIKTTDAFEKIASRNVETAEGNVRMTGFVKGAGMISPDLMHATMISVILTDATISKNTIDDMLTEAVEGSFNMVNVDGDTSTNDMVILLANGKSGISGDSSLLQKGLNEVCLDLAMMLAKDGEGATKFLTVEINGAQTSEDARSAAKAVVRSTLVKTALFGENPNWGRIIAAIGYSGAKFDKSRISLSVKNEKDVAVLVIEGKGIALKGSDEIKKAGVILKSREISFSADLGMGTHSATSFGCDLGHNYVKINSEYTT